MQYILSKIVSSVVMMFLLFSVMLPSVHAQVTITQGSARVGTYDDKKMGLIISTIQAGNWPGSRPVGMEQRLGYSANEHPSDEQIILDVILHAPQPNILYDAINSFFLLLGPVGGNIVVPRGGDLSNANPDDRKWVTLAMLARSTNKPPPSTFSNYDLEHSNSYNSFLLGDFRLLNRFEVAGHVHNGAFVTLDDPNYPAMAAIGPTRLRMQTVVYVQNSVLGLVGIPVIFWSAYIPNDIPGSGGYGNDTYYPNGYRTPGLKPSVVGHRNASRIGPLLREYEDYILKNVVPPPFYNELYFTAGQHTIRQSVRVSNQVSLIWGSGGTGKIWPTANVYKYDFKSGQYTPSGGTLQQIATPFDGFIPWPPPP